jgi:hypothetical protein
MRTVGSVGLGCLLCLGMTATTVKGGEIGPNTVVKEVSVNQERGDPAEVKFLAGRLVLIFRGASRVPEPDGHAVAVLDRDGRQVFTRAPGLDVPGTKVAGIYDAALDENGILVVAMSLVDTEGRAAAVLMEYDVADGRLVRTVRTSPVNCLRVVADGENVWCLGYNAESVRAHAMDFDVVYCFALSGKFLRSLFPRSNFSQPPVKWRGQTPSQLIGLHGQFAAWLPASDALLRWQSDGSGAQQLAVASPGPAGAKGRDEIAMLPDGKIVGLLYAGNEPADSTRPLRAPFILDSVGHASRLPNWGDVPLGYYLAGTDGEALVFFHAQTHSVVWLTPNVVPTGEPTPLVQP